MIFTSTLKKISVLAIAVVMAVTCFAVFAIQQAQAVTYVPLTSLVPGDLIRGQAFPAVYYYGMDGFRYVFPNQKTYDTWYTNFDSVKWITDVDLGKIQIGGNVTYRPGVKMIKIDTDPKTYAIAKGGVLRHVSTEAVAIALYGSTWNKQIEDMPDGFFGNYTIGTAIVNASDFSPATTTASVTTINDDKGLKAPKVISISDTGYSPIDYTVTVGQSVKFTNNGTTKHTVTGDDLSWGSGTLNPGESFSKTFSTAGTYSFFDSYKGSSTGAIYVQ